MHERRDKHSTFIEFCHQSLNLYIPKVYLSHSNKFTGNINVRMLKIRTSLMNVIFSKVKVVYTPVLPDSLITVTNVPKRFFSLRQSKVFSTSWVLNLLSHYLASHFHTWKRLPVSLKQDLIFQVWLTVLHKIISTRSLKIS